MNEASSEHNSEGKQVQPCQRLRQSLIVTCQPPETSSPGEASLHYPAPREQHKTRLAPVNLTTSTLIPSSSAASAACSPLYPVSTYAICTLCPVTSCNCLASSSTCALSCLLAGGLHVQPTSTPPSPQLCVPCSPCGAWLHRALLSGDDWSVRLSKITAVGSALRYCDYWQMKEASLIQEASFMWWR